MENDDYDFSTVKPTKPAESKKRKRTVKYHSKDSDGKDASVVKIEEKKPSKPKRQKKGKFGIWVGNLVFTTTENSVREFFNDCGMITRINMPMKTAKLSKGYVYVDFDSEEGVKNALELNDSNLDGREILIKSSTDFDNTGKLPRGGKRETTCVDDLDGNLTNNKIFIGNLPLETERSDIEELFSKFGKITHLRMAAFEDSQKCKGYAHLEFKRPEHAAEAVQSSKGLKIKGRVLRVEFGAHKERPNRNAAKAN